MPVILIQGGAQFAAGVSTGGNTAGNTGSQVGTVVLQATGGVTLSQVTGAAGVHTVQISAGGGGAIASYEPFTPSSSFSIGQGLLIIRPMVVPANITATRVAFLAHLSGNSNSSGGYSMSVGVYTMSGSTASLASSGSTFQSWTSGSDSTASTGNFYGNQSGTRYRVMTIGSWSMTPGQYLFVMHSLSLNNGTFTWWGHATTSIVSEVFTSVTAQYLPGAYPSGASFATAMPVSINVTETAYNRTGGFAWNTPWCVLQGSV